MANYWQYNTATNIINHPHGGTWGDGGTTDYLKIASDGELTLYGTARVMKEVAFPLDGIGKGATAPTLTRLGNTIGYAFTIGDDGYIHFEIPDDWAATTPITIHLHIYTNETYAANSGETRWQGAWSAIPEDGTEPVDGATHTGTVDSGDVNIPAAAKGMQEIDMSAIAGASLAQHDTIAIKLSRVALVAGSNPTAEPVVISAEYEYYADKLGEAT